MTANRNMPIALSMLIILMLPSFTLACSCGPSEPKNFVIGSDMLFRGKVIATEPIMFSRPVALGDGPSIDEQVLGGMKTTFKIIKQYKGLRKSEIVIEHGVEGSSCGLRFKVGDELNVAAYRNSDDEFRTNLCTMLPLFSDENQGDKKYLVALEQYFEQQEKFEDKLRRSPYNAKLLRQQGAFFVKHKDYENAERVYSKLIELNGKDSKALLARAEIHYTFEHYEDALNDYRAVISIDKSNKIAKEGKKQSLIKLCRLNELDAKDQDFTGVKIDGGQGASCAGLHLAGSKFRNVSLNHLDFSGIDLSDVDFSGSYINKCNFSGANLSGANFENLRGAFDNSFRQAKLQNTNFSHADLRFANFSDTNLGNANFANANLALASFENADIAQANFRDARLEKAKLRGTTWYGKDLSEVNFWGVDLRNAVFENTFIRYSAFEEPSRIGFNGKMRGGNVIDLRGADLSKVNINNVNFGPVLVDCRTKLPQGHDVTELWALPLWEICPGTPPQTRLQSSYPHPYGPTLSKIEAPNAKLSGMDMSGFIILGGLFDDGDFSQTNFDEMEVEGASFKNANFSRVRLTKALITRSDFQNANFENADLSNAGFMSVNFKEAKMKGAKLDGVNYDKTTIWPDGFDPVALGAKLHR